ncbi:MAG: hypothetical protein J5842_04770, partial [Lachnospiraceae bacterium]|nr:hypothetical protein [Lachnospiraceae bacterium]
MRSEIVKKTTKKVIAVIAAATLCLGQLTGCGGVRTENDDRADALSYDDAMTEMGTLLKKVSVSQVSDPVLDIYSEEVSEADALADIDTFPMTVEGNGEIDIEVAAATEMSA